MDGVYVSGARLIKNLQGYNIPPSLFLFASHLGNPPIVNLIAFPLAFFLHPVLGSATLLSINFSEWLNCALKLILNDDRPYWWVKEHSKTGLQLKHFPITCETGPGSPSGHCMVSVAGWLPIILFVRHQYSRFGSVLCFVFLICVGVVATSRLYVAAHFPHQVIFGTILGAVIGLSFYTWTQSYTQKNQCLFENKTFNEIRPSLLLCPQNLVFIAVGSFIMSKIVGIALSHVGVDVHRSYRFALDACDRPEWIHASTSIDASYARVMGAILGLALALVFRPLMPHCSPRSAVTLKRLVLSSVICAIASSVFKAIAQFIGFQLARFASYISVDSDTLFLLSMVIQSAVCPVIVALVFPICFARACVRDNAFFDPHSASDTSVSHDESPSAPLVIDHTSGASSLKCRRSRPTSRRS
uniref:glucose-6-phosphatase n=1 Tax=Mesocestoides corti TaxID=53468 RepID=A0A5K3EKN1_MESCO